MTVSGTKYYDFGRPAVGGSLNIWGTELNQTLDDIDTAIKAQQDLTSQVINENYVINPCFLINQKHGPDGAALTNGKKFSDCWTHYASGSGDLRYGLYQETFRKPAYNNYSLYSARIAANTKDETIDATDYYYICNRIEGYNYHSIRRQSHITLSFWVRSNRTGTYCVSFANSAENRSYVAEYSISSYLWTKKIITLVPDNAGTWLNTDAIGLTIKWTFAAGSNYQCAKNSWTGASYLCTDAQVNFLETTTNAFYLTQVKLESGSIATEFQSRPIQKELELCERYYEKSHNFEIPVSDQYTIGSIAICSFNNSKTDIYGQVRYRTRKIGSGSITSYNHSGTSNMCWGEDITGGVNYFSVTSYTAETGGYIEPTSTINATPGYAATTGTFRNIRFNFVGENQL